MSKLTSVIFLPIIALAAACGDPADPGPEGGFGTEDGTTESDPGAEASTGEDPGEEPEDETGTTGEAEEPDIPARGGITVSLVEANPGVAIPIGANGAWVSPEGRNASLVRGRDTAVRVYVDVDEATWIPRDIEARLSIHRPDGTVEIQSDVTTVAADSSTTSLQSGFLFGVLGQWMEPGVRYQVELFEAGTGWEALPPVEEAPVIPPQPEPIGVEANALQMKVVLVPVSYSGPGCTRDVDASEQTLQRYADAMYQQNPIETLDIRWDSPYVVDDLDLRSGNDFFTLLGRAQAYRASQTPDPNVYYYMLFDNCGACVSESGGCLLGVAAGLPNDSKGAATMRVAIGTQFLGSDEVGMDTFVHEIGHTQGRQHVTCPGVTSGGPDVTYPYENGTIGVWGFGVRDFQIRNASSHTDYMSYCSPTWVSDWQWNATYDRIRTLTSWDYTDASMPQDQAMLVGSIDPESGRAQWWTERGGITTATEGHRLRFLAGDAVLEVGDVQVDAWSEGSGYTVRAPLPAGYDDEVTAIEYLAPQRAYAAPRAQVPAYHQRPDDLTANQ